MNTPKDNSYWLDEDKKIPCGYWQKIDLLFEFIREILPQKLRNSPENV